MSTHCGRYPTCECPSDVGMYCNRDLPIEEIIKNNAVNREHRKEQGIVIRDVNGYPLNDDGSIDWEKTSEEKTAIAEKFERQQRGGSRDKPKRKYPSNYTPPKRRHRK